MIEENELQKIKKEYPEFFNKVSPELLRFIFSEKTLSQINDVCARNGLDGEKIEEVAYRVTFVLLDKLPKESLAIALEGGVGLSREIAEKISAEINGLIFSQIHRSQPVAMPKVELKPEEKPQTPARPDTYREQIE